MTPSRLYDAYIFDLDGTVYLGDALLPTAGETIRRLRALGKRTLFLSNNPTKTRATYVEKMAKLGLPTPEDDIVNSSMVMVSFLKATLPKARLFVVGEAALMQDLRDAGFTLVDQAKDTDAVIASFDRTFEYRKLQVSFDAIRAGARFFATNGDRYCPVPGGGEPDCAAIIAAIEACTDTKCEAVVGKPSRHTIDAILGLVKLPAGDCIMIGDRLETDVKMGNDAGMASALTMTGATTREMLARSPITPSYVIDGLVDLLPAAHR